jgi:hypothetical protein
VSSCGNTSKIAGILDGLLGDEVDWEEMVPPSGWFYKQNAKHSQISLIPMALIYSLFNVSSELLVYKQLNIKFRRVHHLP